MDTNVLLDVLHGDRAFGPRSADALRVAFRLGRVIACDAVWAETTAAVGSKTVGEALEELGIEFDPLDRDAAAAAGVAWASYRARGGARSRVVSDFLVGAHAVVHADGLLTRDRGFYRTYFRKLRVVEP